MRLEELYDLVYHPNQLIIMFIYQCIIDYICVLSPVLFSLFTNEFNCFKLFKYADDTALAGLLQTSDPASEAASAAHTKALQTWCHTSQLEINVVKTKELIFCSRKDVKTEPVSLNGQQVEIVENLKYLGTLLD